MALSEQEARQLMLKYTQLKQQAVVLLQQLQAAQAPKPKLQSFHSTKLKGKKENFESWDTQYQAERILSAQNFNGWTEAQKLAFLTSTVEGRALEVLCSSLLLYAPNPTHTLVYNVLVAAF
jgi:hypothetical protein